MKRIFASFLLLAALTVTAQAATDDGWYLARVHYGTRSPPLPYEMGAGSTPGMSAKAAVYMRGTATRARWGELRRDIPVQAWAGKRMRVTLRVKNEGDTHGTVRFSVTAGDKPSDTLIANPQKNPSGDAWQTHAFVLDMPKDPHDLSVNVSFTGTGAVWVDDLTLTAVGADVPLTDYWRAGSFYCDPTACIRR